MGDLLGVEFVKKRIVKTESSDDLFTLPTYFGNFYW